MTTWIFYLILTSPATATMTVTPGLPSQAACQAKEREAARFYARTAPDARVKTFCIPDKNYYGH